MAKKEKSSNSNEKKKETIDEETELKEEKAGFPEDVDFKKFLGCGG